MKIGDAIPDPGLRMAALDALLSQGALDPETLRTALEPGLEAIRKDDALWFDDDGARKLAADECQEEILQHAVDALAGVDVEADALATIEELSFDGGNEIYMWLEATTAEALDLEDWELDTGGESELYTVRSFRGLGAMPGLVALWLDAYGWSETARDATPLGALTKLRRLDLAGARLDGAGTLTELPVLEELSGSRQIDDATRATLRERGVQVS